MWKCHMGYRVELVRIRSRSLTSSSRPSTRRACPCVGPILVMPEARGFTPPPRPRELSDSTGRKWRKTVCQRVCKPGSVHPDRSELGNHSSKNAVADALQQPTRTTGSSNPRTLRSFAVPIRSCSRWGLPCPPRCRGGGALLPHRFDLAAPKRTAVCFLWHFPSAPRQARDRPGVTRHRCSAEPGLSSPRLTQAAVARPSGTAPSTPIA